MNPPETLEALIPLWLRWLKSHHYSPKTIKHYRTYLNLLLDWCQQRQQIKLQEMTPQLLEAFQRYLLYHRSERDQKTLQVQTQHSICGIVKSLFRWAHRQGYLLNDPSAHMEFPRLPQTLPLTPLTLAQMEEILTFPDIHSPLGLRDRTMLEVFYATAIRCEELTGLTLNDLQTERQLLWIRQGKGSRQRTVPLSPRALQWLERYLQHGREHLKKELSGEVLFLNRFGTPFTSSGCGRRISSYVQRVAPGKGHSCHLIRHSVATLLLENGCDTRYIQELLGHQSLESTQIYTHVSILGLKNAYFQFHPSMKSSTTT